jgi:hypothetical protein
MEAAVKMIRRLMDPITMKAARQSITDIMYRAKGGKRKVPMPVPESVIPIASPFRELKN